MEESREKIVISESIGDVSTLTFRPDQPVAVMVLAHGAGAGMEHSFMLSLSQELFHLRVATVRFNFPYLEHGKRRPDVPPVAEKTVARMLEVTHDHFPGVPVFAGGKSFGGRMSSQRLAKDSPDFVRGIVFFGFPLHPSGSPAVTRAAHLQQVKVPMLFLQGTRDKLADLDLIRSTVSSLPAATLVTLEGADHAFQAGKKNFIPELAQHAARWIVDEIQP